ncbi:MAG: hypothetical protein HRT41_14470 [Campylobacteraceae bacterium]|nr:hypothetical protein [Campylobacteraceae bacterium]
MKRIMKLSSFLVLVALIMTGCPAPIYNVEKSKITKSTESMDSIYKSIETAAESLTWQIKRTGKNEAIAILYIRVHEAKVKITFNEKEYSITYIGGQNLSYKPSEGTIHENYNKWVQKLESSIDEHLKKDSEIMSK